MYLKYRVCYEEYSNNLAQRLKIEQKRQEEYRESRRMIEEIDRKSFYHN